jgi:hypothetical protein
MVGVDKVRDLLFGNQMQDCDRRFHQYGGAIHAAPEEGRAERRAFSGLSNRMARSWSTSLPVSAICAQR